MNQYIRRSVFVGIAIGSITAGYFLMQPEQKRAEINAQSQNKPVEQSSEELALSDDVAFPSPVIQLQQTMAAGIVQVAEPELELIRGDLEAFSDENIPENYPIPDELAELELQLEQFKQLQQRLDTQKGPNGEQ
ncbi:hypothetical protein [Vibrio sagamiensis]|uniref:Uncharacterized protein n=1 Tax=Vibrio sagamiensis NBRC 104589 TaxID=1219064 RepID=A0A511QM04_9VIBR|nr:hypothetical protein [Vibrio sagamiensis]PNQ60472.1 hypothetical protein C1141_11790 [Vibrio agarivorans]GEM77542.1 hypothetical protein VSA01S_36540 [Vibrio sagamiensis NBRC 104589]